VLLMIWTRLSGVWVELWGAVFRLVLIRHVLHEAGRVKPLEANHDALITKIGP
jgi:hypothetical protein